MDALVSFVAFLSIYVSWLASSDLFRQQLMLQYGVRIRPRECISQTCAFWLERCRQHGCLIIYIREANGRCLMPQIESSEYQALDSRR